MKFFVEAEEFVETEEEEEVDKGNISRLLSGITQPRALAVQEGAGKNVILPSFRETLHARALQAKEKNELLEAMKRTESKEEELADRIKRCLKGFLSAVREKYNLSKDEICARDNVDLVYLWKSSCKDNKERKECIRTLYLAGVCFFVSAVYSGAALFSPQEYEIFYYIGVVVSALFACLTVTAYCLYRRDWKRIVSFLEKEGPEGLRARLEKLN